MHKRINDGSKNKKKISYWSINADFYYLEYFQFQLLSQKLKRNPYNVAEKNGNLNIYSFMTTASAADDHVIWSFRMAANGPKKHNRIIYDVQDLVHSQNYDGSK